MVNHICPLIHCNGSYLPPHGDREEEKRNDDDEVGEHDIFVHS